MQPFLAHWPKPLKALLFRLTGVHQANQVLERAWEDGRGTGQLMSRALADLRVSLDIQGQEHFADLGTQGVLIAGNHPHGLIDALALACLAEQSDRDFTMLARHFLTIFEHLRPHLIPLQVDSTRRSVNGRRQFHSAVSALRQGKAVIITPAGRLSLPPGSDMPAEDAPWRSGVVKIAKSAHAPILPVTIELKVPDWVYWLHRINPIVRTIAQVWRQMRRRPEQITLQVHAPVWPQDLPDNDQLATRQLQETVCGQTAAARRR